MGAGLAVRSHAFYAMHIYDFHMFWLVSPSEACQCTSLVIVESLHVLLFLVGSSFAMPKNHTTICIHMVVGMCTGHDNVTVHYGVHAVNQKNTFVPIWHLQKLYTGIVYTNVSGGGRESGFTNFWRGGGLESVAQKLNDPGQSQRAKPFLGGANCPLFPSPNKPATCIHRQDQSLKKGKWY